MLSTSAEVHIRMSERRGLVAC